MQAVLSFFIQIKDQILKYTALNIALKICIVIVISFIVIKIGNVIIRKLLKNRNFSKYKLNTKKMETMASLATSILKYGVYIIAGVIILSDVLQVKSILAAAGVGGIAIGLGIQGLIKDVISGFFIVMEDQYAVGDLITIDSMNGTVEQLELRVTKLRNFNGDLHIIPNGEIKRVTNHTRGNKAVIVDVPVDYGAELSKVFEAANKVCDETTAMYAKIVEPLKVLGITEMNKNNMNLRIIARTHANEQWAVEREVRKRLFEEFSNAGIKISGKD